MSASLVAHPRPVAPDAATHLQRLLALGAAILIVVLLVAVARHVHARFGVHRAGPGALADPWLCLHLLFVGPALPFGMLVMLRRKGGRTHRVLGRCWALLMLLAAGSGLELGQHWSPIHLLSVLTLVTVPIGVRAAIRGDIAAHRRGMTLLFASLVVAGFATLLPMRLLGGWLFGAA